MSAVKAVFHAFPRHALFVHLFSALEEYYLKSSPSQIFKQSTMMPRSALVSSALGTINQPLIVLILGLSSLMISAGFRAVFIMHSVPRSALISSALWEHCLHSRHRHYLTSFPKYIIIYINSHHKFAEIIIHQLSNSTGLLFLDCWHSAAQHWLSVSGSGWLAKDLKTKVKLWPLEITLDMRVRLVYHPKKHLRAVNCFIYKLCIISRKLLDHIYCST